MKYYNLENDFQSFSRNRMDSNYEILKEKQEYKDLHIKYDKLLSALIKDLSADQKKKLDKVLSIMNSISAYESNFTYDLAFNDTIMKLIK